MVAAKKKKRSLFKTGASSSQITNLEQSILKTFNIYGFVPIAIGFESPTPKVAGLTLAKQNVSFFARNDG